MFELPLSTEYVVRENSIGRERNSPPLLFLLHDRDSNPTEFLEQLSAFLSFQYFVVSVRGPVDLGERRFGWFPSQDGLIDKPILQAASSYFEDFLERIFLQLEPNTVFHSCDVIGFGEGAIVALEMLGRKASYFGRVVAIEGGIKPDWVNVIDPDDTFNRDYFILSGVNDATFPPKYAKEIGEELARLSGRIHFKEYDAMHEIVPAMLTDIESFIDLRKHWAAMMLWDDGIACPPHLEKRKGTREFKLK
jgi:predicted esterase